MGLFIANIISLIRIRKSAGPSTEPCGTPQFILWRLDPCQKGSLNSNGRVDEGVPKMEVCSTEQRHMCFHRYSIMSNVCWYIAHRGLDCGGL